MKTITFYSYKGGVGRSLALANIATRLAEYNKQVCLLDFDLEAPGLPYKFSTFLNKHEIDIKRGIVDYIYQFANEGKLSDNILDYSYPFFVLSRATSLTTLIPAGNTNASDYWKKLSSINWNDLLYENSSGLRFLFDLKDKIKREISPDFLLIDSRTGITEMSGISLSLLADDIVVFAANNSESFEGSKKIIKSISNPNNNVLGKTPKITFVLTRIPVPESSEEKIAEQQLTAKIERESDNLISKVNIIHSDRDLELNEQIKIGSEKDGIAVQISLDYENLFEKLIFDYLTPEEITGFKNIKEAEKDYRASVSEDSPIKKLEFINRAIKLNPYNKEFFLHRAIIYDQLSDELKVIENCDAAILLDTMNIRAYELKGRTLLKLRQYEKAKDAFAYILKVDKSHLNAKLDLASIYASENDYNKALSYYTEVIELDPDNVSALVGRANIKIQFGNYFPAQEDIYSALEINPDYAAAFSVLAEINAHINNKNEFYLNVEQALKLNTKLMSSIINEKVLYKTFFNDKRFLKIIDRYNVQLDIDKNLNNDELTDIKS